jgi:uncharacterized metal-binding protein
MSSGINGRRRMTIMSDTERYQLEVTKTHRVCPIGETAGRQYLEEGKTPVLSCEGACIRGEIARLAANMIAKEEGYARACHGELLTAPHSEIANWAKNSDKVVLIDGCFMSCHGRVLENLLGKDNLLRFDALSVYKKYTDRIDIDSVPEEERRQAARQVADAMLEKLAQGEAAESTATCTA